MPYHTVMTPPSVAQRQELLDLIEDILQYPEKYGDRSFSEKVHNSKDGMVLISFLHSLVTEVGHVPIEYIQYCIPLDLKTRFRLSSDKKMVGLFDHYSNEETDSRGFIKQLDDEQERTTDDVTSPGREENNTDSANKGAEDNRKTEAKIKYTPSIFSRLLKQETVMPTIYQDGKFFIDTEHNEQHDPIEGARGFKYDLLEIDPIGLRNPIDRFFVRNSCFNCGSVQHKIGDCLIPVNRERVERNRRIISQDSKGGRLHTELELQNRINGVAPGVLSDRLRDALGMTSADDKPPYYRNIRWFGYPPGYMGIEEDKLQYGATLTLEDLKRSKAYPLEIYDDNCVDTAEMDENSNKQRRQQNDESQHLVQLVHYPGLDLLDTTQLDRRLVSAKDQPSPPQPPPQLNQQQLEQQYWDYYYYLQGQQYPEQQQQQQYHYDYLAQYSYDEPIYAPGTLPTQPTQQAATANSQPTTFNGGSTTLNATDNTSRVENSIWSILRQRRQAKANSSGKASSSMPAVNVDMDDQSDDMDISDDDG